MCTASWVEYPESFQFIFNRDEHHQRKIARAVQLSQHNDISALFPIDGDFGGTWLAVNEYGLVISLLNYYPKRRPPTPKNKKSRGFIIPELIYQKNLSSIYDRFQSMELHDFEPFDLLVVNDRAEGSMFRWDGYEVERHNVLSRLNPLSSSSFVTQDVVLYRRKVFEEKRPAIQNSPKEHLAYHFDQDSHSSRAFTPLMWRPIARTVSVSQILIDDSKVSFDYHPIPVVGKRNLESTHKEMPRK